MTAPLLLDTCAALWIMDNAELQEAAVAAIDEAADRGEPVYLSPITGWEIGLLAWKGRFRSALAPQRWLDQLLARPEIALAEMPPRVLLESSLLPGSPPADPADRIIAATAREYGYVVVTRDRLLLDYAVGGYNARPGLLNPGVCRKRMEFMPFSASSCRKTLENRFSILPRERTGAP